MSPLVFPPNSTAVNIMLSITDDTLDEVSETVIFTLGALTNATAGAQPVYTASITDNDEPPTTDYSGLIQQPINADGSSTFNVRKGVVPVKFTLTLDGVSTCTLPPASIRVSRIGGATPGPIDESVYQSPADSGSSFRIADCAYAYNLAAKSFGVGLYSVELLIGGLSEGVGTFELK